MTISVHTLPAFQALVKRDPAAAQAWLKEVAAHSQNILSADQLGALKTAALLEADAFAKDTGSLPLDALFGAAPVMGAGNASLNLPVVHGKLTVDRGTKMVRGEQGYREWPELKLTLTADDGRTFLLESDHDNRNDIFQFVPGTDVMAFDGQEVSLRGRLDPNPNGDVLRVTEFAPGNVDDFVTGRVVLNGDTVSVRARGRGLIEVKDPELKAQLRSHSKLGVILVGTTSEHPQADGSVTRTFDDAQPEYWMLVLLKAAPTPAGDGKVTGPVEAATSQTETTIELPSEQVKNIEVNDRMYVFGSFDGAQLKASKATPSAGSPWTTASHQRWDPIQTVVQLAEAQEPI
jgi:hypothetical protein